VNYGLLRVSYFLVDYGYITIVGSMKAVCDIYFMRQLTEFKGFAFFMWWANPSLTGDDMAGLLLVVCVLVGYVLSIGRVMLLRNDRGFHELMDIVSPMPSSYGQYIRLKWNLTVMAIFEFTIPFAMPHSAWLLRLPLPSAQFLRRLD
jgi:hypothetical protein